MRTRVIIAILLVFCVAGLYCLKPQAQDNAIRVGYFPNITHAQAIVGLAMGTFQGELGENVKLQTRTFNAGPSVIEAMFAGALDLAYIGPNPAINGYIKSDGKALRIIAGAASGGAGMVVRQDAGISGPEDFHGKKIASPQLGNTQDVALRSWLKRNGLKLKEKGGDVTVMPIANPDQLTLFTKKEIDGAWTVEPWVSRLIKEADGRMFLDERQLWPNGDFVTANIIVSKAFLDKNPELVKKWLSAHVDTTLWINANIEEAKNLLNAEIKTLTGAALGEDILNSAFSRLKITYDPVTVSLFESAKAAFEQGFLGDKEPDLKGIYDLGPLNQVLKDKKLGQVK